MKLTVAKYCQMFDRTQIYVVYNILSVSYCSPLLNFANNHFHKWLYICLICILSFHSFLAHLSRKLIW